MLYGAQELYYYKDTKRIRQLEGQMSAQRPKISQIEGRLTGMDTAISSLEERMDALDAGGLIEQYNDLVDHHNELVGSYRNLVREYELETKSYNGKVGEANRLIRKSGKRWYLIPIPVPRRASRALH